MHTHTHTGLSEVEFPKIAEPGASGGRFDDFWASSGSTLCTFFFLPKLVFWTLLLAVLTQILGFWPRHRPSPGLEGGLGRLLQAVRQKGAGAVRRRTVLGTCANVMLFIFSRRESATHAKCL